MTMKNEKHSESVQDLIDEEAVKKIKEIVKHNPICMFASNLTHLPLQIRPMSTQEADDEGNIWFLSSKDSNKNFEVSEDPRVQLFFGEKANSEYLSVFGYATIIRDKKTIEEVWSPIAKAWFQEGKDDPHLTVIKVQPESAYYWDTKSSKMVQMLKIAASVVVGRTMDDGVEGKLNIR
jgi:general stress protein 26